VGADVGGLLGGGLDDLGREALGRPRRLLQRGPGDEGDHHLAHRQGVAVLDLGGLGDLRPVHLGAVEALEILDEEAAALLVEPGVLARHPGLVEHDVVVVVPTDLRFAVESEALPLLLPLRDDESEGDGATLRRART
jgi:hypothetical protein